MAHTQETDGFGMFAEKGNGEQCHIGNGVFKPTGDEGEHATGIPEEDEAGESEGDTKGWQDIGGAAPIQKRGKRTKRARKA